VSEDMGNTFQHVLLLLLEPLPEIDARIGDEA
jgi:hypothetical protein